MRPEKIASIDAAIEKPSHSPTALEFRLAGLADQDLASQADRLLEVVAGLRDSHIPVAERYHLLRRCLGYASRLRSSLSEQLEGPSLPPPASQITLSRRCAGVYRLMADCFRAIAEDIAAQETSVPLSNATRLARACYRGIDCLGHYIVIRCECYLKAGSGVWLDIHRLHDLAVSEGVHRLPLGGRSAQARTVDDAYKRLLLLGLSDPFQQSFRDVGRLYEKLGDWASLTSLATTDRPATRCLFVVDPRLDRPATPALSQTGLRPEFDQRWFITKELLAHLKQEYDLTIDRSAENFHRRESSTDELGSIDFLRRMIVRWGIHPVRTGRRRKTARSCEVVAGLQSVCLALNGFKPMNLDGLETVAGFRSMIQGTFRHEPVEHSDDSPVRNGWEIEDESENGFKLVCRPTGGCGVGVDDLVAVKAVHARDWSVGTVHWAQTDESGSVALGVRLIRLAVRPVVIDPLQAGPEVARSEALLFADKSGDGLRRSLICPPWVYYPTGAYLIRRPGGQGEFAVEATNILLSSRSFVWFEVIKPQAGTAQKVLDLIQSH